MNNNAHIEPVKLKDIRDKELLYLVIRTPQGKQIINVGQKTYDAVNELLNPKQEKEEKKGGKL